MTKVYIENGQWAMQEVFTQIGWIVVREIQDSDVVVLIGGADIHPSWYGKQVHNTTYASIPRDEGTKLIYDWAVANNKPILGVCRGAQMINALQGGDMYQDVDNHAHGRHKAYDLVTKSYHTVNSIHHQMMIPTHEAVLIAVAVKSEKDHNGLSTYRERVDKHGLVIDEPQSLDTGRYVPEWEAFFYPRVRGLCFQAHPEYDTANGPCRAYFYELLKRYLPELVV